MEGTRSNTVLDELLDQLCAECGRLQQENHELKVRAAVTQQLSKQSKVLATVEDNTANGHICHLATDKSRHGHGQDERPFLNISDTEADKTWPAGLSRREVFVQDLTATTTMGTIATIESCPSGRSSKHCRQEALARPGASALKRQQAVLLRVGAVHPSSRKVKLHDFFGMICVLYELAATPYAVAWQVPLKGPYLMLSCVVSVYWIWDLLLTFNTGFYDRLGQLRMARKTIACHYLHRSFFIDLCLVVSDWSIIGLGIVNGSDTANSSYMIVRVSRFLKVLKIIRLVRLSKGVDSILLWSVSHGNVFAATLCKLVLGTLMFAHVLACVWYLLGRQGPTDTGSRWTYVFEDAGSAPYEYMCSIHFVVAMMTMYGTTDATAVNTAERIFSTSLTLISYFLGAALTSYVGAMVLEKVMLRRDRTATIEKLRDFLRQHKLTPKLAAQVERQAICRLSTDIPMKESSVGALQMISATLRLEIRYELRMPHLGRLPLFQVWKELDATAIESLCQNGVENEFLVDEDDLFLPRTQAQHMYFTVLGLMAYEQMPGSSMVKSAARTAVHDGTWVCEAAIWSHWYHVGRMTAESTCHVLSVSAASVERVFLAKPALTNTTTTYANNFHDRITVAIPPAADWPSDIYVPHTEFTDLLSAGVDLELLTRSLINGETDLTTEQENNLKKELESGACRLQTNNAGGLLRVVALVTICLRQDEHIFAQLGTWSLIKGVKAKVQLPGTKRRRGELPCEAVQRLLQDDFCTAGFGEHSIKVTSTEFQSQTMPSATCGIDTTYLRSVQNAVVDVDDDEVLPPALHALKGKPGAVSVESIRNVGDVVLRDVYAAPKKHDVALYAWITEAELKRLSDPRLSEALNEWLASLEGFDTVGQKTKVTKEASVEETTLAPLEVHETVVYS